MFKQTDFITLEYKNKHSALQVFVELYVRSEFIFSRLLSWRLMDVMYFFWIFLKVHMVFVLYYLQIYFHVSSFIISHTTLRVLISLFFIVSIESTIQTTRLKI